LADLPSWDAEKRGRMQNETRKRQSFQSQITAEQEPDNDHK
jgi:hypothetical protein